MGRTDEVSVLTTSSDGGSSTGSTDTNPNSGSNRSNSNRTQRSSRKDQNLAVLSAGDKEYKGACSDLEMVIGLATETPSLKYGKVYSEFMTGLLIYVQANYTRGNDLRPLIYELKDPRNTLRAKEPTHPEDEDEIDNMGNVITDKDGNTIKKTATKSDEKKWELKMKKHMEREELLEENYEKIFGLITRQCTQGLIAEV